MSLSKEDQKFYDDLLDTFSTDGWMTLVNESRIEYNNTLKTLASETDHGKIREAQGKLMVLDRFINLEEYTKQTYDQALNEAREAYEDGPDV